MAVARAHGVLTGYSRFGWLGWQWQGHVRAGGHPHYLAASPVVRRPPAALYGAIRYSMALYGTIRYSTAPYGATRYYIVLLGYATVLYGTLKYCTISPVRYDKVYGTVH